MREYHRPFDWDDSRSDCFSFLCAGVDKPGSHVGPEENFTYVWQVVEGPSSSDPPCIPYLYYSATDPVKDTNSGLVGPLLVCKKGALGKDGTQVLLLLSIHTHRNAGIFYI